MCKADRVSLTIYRANTPFYYLQNSHTISCNDISIFFFYTSLIKRNTFNPWNIYLISNKIKYVDF